MTTYNIQLEVPDDVTPEQLHENLCLVIYEGAVPDLAYTDIGFPGTTHKEHRLGGLVEAALCKAYADEKWLQDMADDPDIEQNTPIEVFLAVESYITDELALTINN